MKGEDDRMRTAEEVVDSEFFRGIFDFFDLGLDSVEDLDSVEVYLPEKSLDSFKSGSPEDTRVMAKLTPEQLDELDQGPWKEIDSMDKAYNPDGSEIIIEITDERPEGENITDRYENLEFKLFKEDNKKSRLDQYGEDLDEVFPGLPGKDEIKGEKYKKAEPMALGSGVNKSLSQKADNTNRLLRVNSGKFRRSRSSRKQQNTDLTDVDDLKDTADFFYDEERENKIEEWMLEKDIYDDQGPGIGNHRPTEIDTSLVAKGFEDIEESASDYNEVATYVHHVVRALGNLAEQDLEPGDGYKVMPYNLNQKKEFEDINKLASKFHSSLGQNLSYTDKDTVLAYDIGFASALVAEKSPFSPNEYNL